jgi:hypothetical protein
MIKLNNVAVSGSGSSNIKSYVSSSISHTSNNTGTLYSINHNFGVVPDLVLVQALVNGVWLNTVTQYLAGGQTMNWQIDEASTLNTTSIRVAQPTYSRAAGFDFINWNGLVDIRFVCYSFTGSVAQPTSFEWSTVEQVYPFEKTSDGSTLYAIEVPFGYGPNNGVKTVAHNIPGDLDVTKLHDVKIPMMIAPGNYAYFFPYEYWAGQYSQWFIDSTVVNIQSNANFSGYIIKVRLLYAK